MSKTEKAQARLVKARESALKLSARLDKARELVVKLEEKCAEGRLAELSKVKMVKKPGSYVLTFKGRTVTTTFNHEDFTLDVWESGQKILEQYLGSVNDLRFAIAQGRL
jgi:hypothetical protein